jgi:hypothetical protein
MPLPFPGMDPFLEDPLLWPDFHQRLASELGRQLTPLLRPRYFAALEPRVVYEPLDTGELRIMFPDVGVMEPPTTSSPPGLREALVTYAQEGASPTPAPLKRLVPMYMPVKTQITSQQAPRQPLVARVPPQAPGATAQQSTPARD